MRPRPLGDARIDIAGVEQGGDDRIDRLVRTDFVWMDAAKNQQMIFFRQVVERPDYGIEPLVATKKAKDPDQLAALRHRPEHGEFLRRCGAADFLCFGGAEK